MSEKTNPRIHMTPDGARFIMRLPSMSEWCRLVEILDGDPYNELFWKNNCSYFPDWSEERLTNMKTAVHEMGPKHLATVQIAGMTSPLDTGHCNINLIDENIGFRPAFVPTNPAIMKDVEDGDKIAIGTLYMDDQPVERPMSTGCIDTKYESGAKLTFGPMEKYPKYHVLAVKAGNVLICDRPMIGCIKFTELCEALAPAEREVRFKLNASIKLTKQQLDKVLSGSSEGKEIIMEKIAKKDFTVKECPFDI